MESEIRADELAADGDSSGAAVWQQITDAIVQFVNTTRFGPMPALHSKLVASCNCSDHPLVAQLCRALRTISRSCASEIPTFIASPLPPPKRPWFAARISPTPCEERDGDRCRPRRGISTTSPAFPWCRVAAAALGALRARHFLDLLWPSGQRLWVASGSAGQSTLSQTWRFDGILTDRPDGPLWTGQLLDPCRRRPKWCPPTLI